MQSDITSVAFGKEKPTSRSLVLSKINLMDTITTNIWKKTQRELKGYVYHKVKDKAMADDIVQDVFLKVHSNLAQLKDTDKMTGWIFRITSNAINDHFRIKSKSLKFSDLDWDSDNQTLNDCVGRCLSEMLVTLPEKYREALELSEIQDLSQIDLAKKLNIFTDEFNL